MLYPRNLNTMYSFLPNKYIDKAYGHCTQARFFRVFGITQPGIEPWSPGPLVNTLPIDQWASFIYNGRIIIGFIPFPRVLALWEMQTALSKILTWFSEPISYYGNHYTTNASTNTHTHENIKVNLPSLNILNIPIKSQHSQ